MTPADGQTPFAADDELVAIASVHDLYEGEIIVGRLGADGIDASVFFEPTSELVSLDIGAHPIQVVVRRGQAEAALRILAHANDWDDAEVDRQMSMLQEASPILRKEDEPGTTGTVM